MDEVLHPTGYRCGHETRNNHARTLLPGACTGDAIGSLPKTRARLDFLATNFNQFASDFDICDPNSMRVMLDIDLDSLL